jgi:peptidylprolyl isomerase
MNEKRNRFVKTLLPCVSLLATWITAPANAASAQTPGFVAIIEKSASADWRRVPPENQVYFNLTSGQVVFELADAFAPKHAAAIRTLVRQKYFDGASFSRVEDNYVAQVGREESDASVATETSRNIPAEFWRPSNTVSFELISRRDPYADAVGFSAGFPVAVDVRSGQAWLAHCYGMVGAARSNSPASGSATELYVVIGHSPRELDRNATLVGRVLLGMEHLSSLERGRAARGVYDSQQHPQRVTKAVLASDLPEKQRMAIEVLLEGSNTFKSVLSWLQDRRDEWNRVPARGIDLCNIPIVARRAQTR